jgi:pyruvate,water dikinase
LDDDAMRLYAQIATKLPQLYEAHRYHIIVSSGAGMLEPALMQVLARQEKLDDEALHAQLAAVLAGASSGDVESADIAHGIQRIIQALLETPDAQTQFGDTKPEQALQWIASDSAGAAGESYRHYLQLHGHRAVQEFEMRQVEWEADPLPLITSIQAAYSVQRQQGNNTERNNQTKNNQQLFNSLNAGTRWLVKKTQQAVQQRERSKSLLVKITTVFKKAYRHLAQLLVDAGKLQAIDDIYFLTHQEIGALLSSSSAHPWRDMITRRRTAFAYQETLEFEQVCRGLPEPITQRHGGDFSDGVLYGKAVSRGRIEGRVRVVKTLQEATALQAGDILVTPATDIGWTPFFGVIGGLVCDIGSSVSHGAVIAREYGLPAVVNTQNATVIFQTGDTVLLDGDNGSVTLLSRAAS